MILPADGCSAQEVFEPSLADALQALLLQMLRSATLLAEKALASQEIRRTLAAAEHTLSQLLRLQIVGPANRLSCPQPASDGQTRALVDDKSGGEALIAEDVDSRASDAGRAHAQLRATLGLALRELLHSLLPRLPRPVGEANRLLAALVEALGNGVPQVFLPLLLQCGVAGLQAIDAEARRGAASLLTAVAPRLLHLASGATCGGAASTGAEEAASGKSAGHWSAKRMLRWIRDELELKIADDQTASSSMLCDLRASFYLDEPPPTGACTSSTDPALSDRACVSEVQRQTQSSAGTDAYDGSCFGACTRIVAVASVPTAAPSRPAENRNHACGSQRPTGVETEAENLIARDDFRAAPCVPARRVEKPRTTQRDEVDSCFNSSNVRARAAFKQRGSRRCLEDASGAGCSSSFAVVSLTPSHASFSGCTPHTRDASCTHARGQVEDGAPRSQHGAHETRAYTRGEACARVPSSALRVDRLARAQATSAAAREQMRRDRARARRRSGATAPCAIEPQIVIVLGGAAGGQPPAAQRNPLRLPPPGSDESIDEAQAQHKQHPCEHDPLGSHRASLGNGTADTAHECPSQLPPVRQAGEDARRSLFGAPNGGCRTAAACAAPRLDTAKVMLSSFTHSQLRAPLVCTEARGTTVPDCMLSTGAQPMSCAHMCEDHLRSRCALTSAEVVVGATPARASEPRSHSPPLPRAKRSVGDGLVSTSLPRLGSTAATSGVHARAACLQTHVCSPAPSALSGAGGQRGLAWRGGAAVEQGLRQLAQHCQRTDPQHHGNASLPGILQCQACALATAHSVCNYQHQVSAAHLQLAQRLADLLSMDLQHHKN